jgi:hypothetical protein
LVPLFWAPYRDPSKIRETGRELASWPKLKKIHNNKLEIDNSIRRDVGERQAGVGACDKTLSHCSGDDWDNKK